MIINILLIILCIVNPLLAIYCYRKAIQDMQRVNTQQEIKTSVELPKIPHKHKPTKEELENQKARQSVNDFKVVL